MKVLTFFLLIVCVFCGILLISDLRTFFDPFSLTIVILPVIASIPARHGFEGFGNLFKEDEERKKVLNTMGATGIIAGVLGTQIGFVTMLSSLENKSAIGDSMASSLLSSFYGVFIFLLTTILAHFILGKES